MSEHNHEHAPATVGIPVDPDETARIRAEAEAEGATAAGHFLRQAENATTLRERAFWLGKVDSARYFAKLEKTRERLDARARENMAADARLMGTEASLELVRAVGNAVVLKIKPGEKPPGGGHSLIRRLAGETGTEGYGQPTYPSHWVVQGLAMNAVHEFAVVSADDATAKEVTGPWLPVPIGSVSTEAIQKAEYAAAEKEYDEREDAEIERQRQHSAAVAQRRKNRQEALREQQEQADIDNARRERRRIEREEAHRIAVAELPLVAPLNLSFRLRDLKAAGMVCDIEFMRGAKAPDIYQFKVDGTVLGYYPDGRHSGRKPTGHIYQRTVTVPRGRNVEIHIYGVTKHGDGGEPVNIPVPDSLCEPEKETPAPTEPSRMDRIVAAVRTYSGRRTRRGAPYLRNLRRHANMPDITSKERHEAYRKA